MTVKLAAQVLSQTTAKALIQQNKHDTLSTITFINIFDKVFDCLNVSNINKGRNSKKELAVYTSPDDWRFKVCFCLFFDSESNLGVGILKFLCEFNLVVDFGLFLGISYNNVI